MHVKLRLNLHRFRCYVHRTNLSASIFRHRLSMSFDMLDKQGSKYTNHMPVFASCHFFGNESQVQKVKLVGYDWVVDFNPCLFGVSKDNVTTCMSNDI